MDCNRDLISVVLVTRTATTAVGVHGVYRHLQLLSVELPNLSWTP